MIISVVHKLSQHPNTIFSRQLLL